MYIPSEIVKEILLRLPARSILKFRCVRKSWNKYLKRDDFVKKQLIHSIEKNNSKLVFTSDDVRAIFSIDYDQSSSLFASNEKIVEMVDSAFSGNEVQICCSCNGLFFIEVCQGLATALWNPATKEYKMIGMSYIEPAGFRSTHHFSSYGFGYDCRTSDYKLVSIASPHDKDIMVAEVEVYTLGSNSWKRLEYIPYKITSGPPGVFVNDALHWLANPFPSRSENVQVLLSFNMAEEAFNEVPQLEIFEDNKKFEHKRVDVVEGCLSMLCSHSNVGFEVWVMSEYGVRDSWTKRYTISGFKIKVIPSFRFLRRVRSLKNGEMLLEIELDDENKYTKYSALVFYDPKQEKSRLVDIDLGNYNRNWNNSSSRKKFYTESYMESLVSLHSGTYVGSAQEESDLDEALEEWDDGWYD